MAIRLQLPFDVTEEDVEWLQKVLPALTAAVLGLRRAGRHGHESELIPLFVSGAALSVDDVQRLGEAHWPWGATIARHAHDDSPLSGLGEQIHCHAGIKLRAP